MKKVFLLFISLFIFGCASNKETVVEEKILTGKIVKEMFTKNDFAWFDRNYNNYSIADSSKIELEKYLTNDISCKIFMGSWCSDSRRDVPKFIKIADTFKYLNFELIGLDRKKSTQDGLEVGYKIEKVPTFIFYKSGKEIGRIIENPSKSIHEDIVDILKKAN